jgi:hypothetical protein
MVKIPGMDVDGKHHCMLGCRIMKLAKFGPVINLIMDHLRITPNQGPHPSVPPDKTPAHTVSRAGIYIPPLPATIGAELTSKDIPRQARPSRS